MSTPDRPDSVPADAEWDESDREWVVSGRNPAGEQHGEVHYYRPDGSLVSISHFDEGVLQGVSRRFHPNGEVSQTAVYRDGELNGKREWFASDEPTPEIFYVDGLSRTIVRAQVTYVDGRVAGPFHYFDSSGEEVEIDGSPKKERPRSVPKAAVWRPDMDLWVKGEWDEAGRRVGELRSWYEDGTLAVFENYVDNVATGLCEMYRRDGTLLTKRTYVDDELEGPIECFYRSGTLARRVEVSGGLWRSDLVDIAPDGRELERTPAPAAALEPVDEPLAAETAWIESLADETPLETPESLSPEALADLIVIAWGGNIIRDDEGNVIRGALQARGARAVVRAYPDNALRSVLETTKLVRAPRLYTVKRTKALMDGLQSVDAVDSARLMHSLSTQSEVGLKVGALAGGEMAVRSLRSTLNDDKLDLTGRNLTELPIEIRHIYETRVLDLSYNELESVEDAVADLIQLRVLRAANNRITAVTPRLGRLNELRTLNLNSNKLQNVPESVVECTELRSLNLGQNEIRNVPAAIGMLSELDHLWLHYNPLRDLPETFANLRLRFLHLGSVPWSEPPPVLWELEQLETLWLTGKNLRQLPDAIAKLSNLKKLSLWHGALESIPEALFGMRHLEELRLSGNPLPDAEVEAIRRALPDTKIL